MAEHLNHPFKEDNTVYTMGLAATLSPFSRYNSSSRMQMVTGHRSHEIVPRVPDIPRCLTGFEDQLAGFTFNITMPHNAEVISIHRKYITGGGYGSIQKNPVTTVIYQNADTGEYDCIDITEYFSTHETFGVKLELTRVGRSLYRGLTIPKGTVLAEAPTCKDGVYRNGLHTQVVYIDDPASDEDGFRISDEYAARMSPLEVGTSVCEWGKQCYPLNIYGDENSYKPHPDIGETIREDAIVFATRTYHPLFDAIEMLPRNLSRIDYIHDKRTYAPGMEGATVHDVKVESGIGEARVKVQTPEGMGDHSKKYIDGLSIYYDEIIQCYKNLCQMNHFKPVAISPRLQKLIVSALGNEPNKDKSFTNHANKKTKNVGLVRRCYKGTPLDEYRVEIHFNKWKIINNGAKVTDQHGGKGVICSITKKENMPVDSAGNRADLVVFTKSTVSRLNTGQWVEQFINACSRDMAKWIRENSSVKSHEELWTRLMAYYQAAAPRTYEGVSSICKTKERQQQHLKSIIDDDIYLIIRADDKHLSDIYSLYDNITKVIKPTYGPVTYVNCNGETVTTKDPVLIGPKHMMVLQQTDHKPMAVSSAKIQHHGLLGGVTRETRNSHPIKQQAQRSNGETEVRLYAATMGADFVAEQMDMANNPDAMREAVRTILNADKFSEIEELVKRDVTPLGGSRALQYVTHLLRGYGIDIVENVYDDEN